MFNKSPDDKVALNAKTEATPAGADSKLGLRPAFTIDVIPKINFAEKKSDGTWKISSLTPKQLEEKIGTPFIWSDANYIEKEGVPYLDKNFYKPISQAASSIQPTFKP